MEVAGQEREARGEPGGLVVGLPITPKVLVRLHLDKPLRTR